METGRVGPRPPLALRPPPTTRITPTDGPAPPAPNDRKIDDGKDRQNDITLPTWLQMFLYDVWLF